MYKLLIVDDEKAVRDRLKNTDWSRFEIGEIGKWCLINSYLLFVYIGLLVTLII